jgi:uncharacterized protein YueI
MRLSLNSGAFGPVEINPESKKEIVRTEIIRIFLTLGRFMRVNTINFAEANFTNF